jgi:hypothetical protein
MQIASGRRPIRAQSHPFEMFGKSYRVSASGYCARIYDERGTLIAGMSDADFGGMRAADLVEHAINRIATGD